MFRTTILPIFRNIRLCNTACGMLYPIRRRSVIWWRRNWLLPSPNHRPATYWVQHTTNCSLQSNVPEDGRNCRPKHVKSYLGFINKLLLLHLVGLLFYHRRFLSMFISFLYMFRATMCLSSGETTVFMRHLVVVILYGWLLFLLMMGT